MTSHIHVLMPIANELRAGGRLVHESIVRGHRSEFAFSWTVSVCLHVFVYPGGLGLMPAYLELTDQLGESVSCADGHGPLLHGVDLVWCSSWCQEPLRWG